LKPYRGRGVGKMFFHLREKVALQYPGINYTCFCAVERNPEHPLKPDNYVSLDGFWEKLGYQKSEDLYAKLWWKDLDHKEETEKRLNFWIKKLR
jgi:hypothetical protein